MMKKIIATVRAEASQTSCNTAKLRRPLSSARIIAPKAPTAPASLGVAQPMRMEPLISAIRNTGGMKLRIKSAGISPAGTVKASGGSGGASDGFMAHKAETNTR